MRTLLGVMGSWGEGYGTPGLAREQARAAVLGVIVGLFLVVSAAEVLFYKR
ncbi:MAG: hypothetical protein GXP62_14335, partial [Oligoflexia bacterium]|nr:hypothetical protein [Oligoflexia bacterium]